MPRPRPAPPERVAKRAKHGATQLHAAARRLDVARFGGAEPIEVSGDQVITFPRGVVGMDDLRAFALLEDERIAPCRWLQSLEDPGLVFVVVDPHVVEPAYEAHVPEEEAAWLQLEHPEDASVWALVTVQADPAHSSVNLLAPVVINQERRIGAQLILHETDYSLRQPIAPHARPQP